MVVGASKNVDTNQGETMSEMTEERAREILGDAIKPDGGLLQVHEEGEFIEWEPRQRATLDGRFTADKLEAIVFWMRKHA